MVGIYARLSRDDGTNNVSESIENQIKFLKSYAKEKSLEIEKIYIDDGYTGTNFNRPRFQTDASRY